MDAVWVLLVVIFTSNSVAIETVEFGSRDLCTGARAHLVDNFKGRTGTDVIEATCIQTRRNTP